MLAPFLATRLALTLAALLATSLLPPTNGTGDWQREQVPALIAVWSRWDGFWYALVATQGYAADVSSTAFSPLLPILMRGLALALGRTDLAAILGAGIVVSNLALLASLGYLVALLRRHEAPATARRAVLYLLLFPSSLFLSAVYPQSLFLLCSVAAFYYADLRRWWLAGVLYALAVLTRPHGVLLAAPLALLYLQQRHFRWRDIRSDVLALGIGVVAFAGWAAYLYGLTGDPLHVARAGVAWRRALTPPWDVLQLYLSRPPDLHPQLDSPPDLAYMLLFGVLVLAAWGGAPPAWALFGTLWYGLVLCSGTWTSSMRYGLELFPAFLVLAHLGSRPRFHVAYVLGAGLLGILYAAVFGLGYWVA